MKATIILVAACLLLAGQAAPAHANAAAGPAPPDAAVLGNDISWPQCGGNLPAPPAFAVVGVNGGRPDTVNHCLPAQLAWADHSSDAAAGTASAVYVNTAATGPVDSLWWPAANSYQGKDVVNPYGLCDGAASPACAYVHGYAMASNDVADLRAAGDVAVRHMWWLDVETGNSWLRDKAANAAELEGMAAFLESTGAEVGIYSTAYQFGEIVGTLTPGSRLSGLKSWLAGAESTSTAQELCGAAPLTPGGSVALAQFTDGDLDYNYRCPAPPGPAPAPALPVPAPALPDSHAPLNAAQIS